MTDIQAARTEHQALLSRLMRGPSDGEGAMRRAESAYGLPYWPQWNLRHKARASFEFIGRVHQTYLAVVERSVKRDLAFLENEIAKGAADVGIESLVAEAETLLAKIEAARARHAA